MTVPRDFRQARVSGVEHGAAAGGQHDAVLAAQVADHLRFAAAKARLALDFEDPRDRGAGAGLDLMVGVDEAHAQFAGKDAADGGFSRPHQPD